MKRPLVSVSILYLVGTLTVGFVHFTQTSYSTNGKDNPSEFVEAAQSGLSWPLLVFEAVADRHS